MTAPKDMYQGVLSSTICNDPELETTPMPVNKRIDTYTVLCSHIEYSAAMEANVLFVKIWRNLTDMMLNSDKEGRQKR